METIEPTPELIAAVKKSMTDFEARYESGLPADREKAEAAMEKIYRIAGCIPPKVRLWFLTPLDACAAAVKLLRGMEADAYYEPTEKELVDEAQHCLEIGTCIDAATEAWYLSGKMPDKEKKEYLAFREFALNGYACWPLDTVTVFCDYYKVDDGPEY